MPSSLAVAINALQSAGHPHHFLGITQQGQSAVFRTRGNRYGHMGCTSDRWWIAADRISRPVVCSNELQSDNGSVRRTKPDDILLCC
jgi:hypothetical protein